MFGMRRNAGAAVLLTIAVAGYGYAKQSGVGTSPDAVQSGPQLFAEGVVSTGDNEFSTTFAPDGRTVYWTVSAPNVFEFPFAIVTSRRVKGQWSEPAIAPFSGTGYSDGDPAVSPDGQTVVFMSRRPVSGTTQRPDFDIYSYRFATRETRRIDAVSTDAMEISPSITANGTLYFTSDRAGGRGKLDIYRARLVDGHYATPENIGDVVNTDAAESNVYVSRDEAYIIFSSDRAGGAGRVDLYYSKHNADDTWSAPRALAGGVNTPEDDYAPAVSPDGKLLYFTSRRPRRPVSVAWPDYRTLQKSVRGAGNGNADIYVVPLAEALR